MVYSRILYLRYKEFKMTCYRRNYVTSCELVDCIPMNWDFFLKKCKYAYTCVKKKETLINFPSEVQLIRRREIEI